MGHFSDLRIFSRKKFHDGAYAALAEDRDQNLFLLLDYTLPIRPDNCTWFFGEKCIRRILSALDRVEDEFGCREENLGQIGGGIIGLSFDRAGDYIEVGCQEVKAAVAKRWLDNHVGIRSDHLLRIRRRI